MATVVDSVPIDGMKNNDFEQLNKILLDHIEEGGYYGRKDWYYKRNARLLVWLNEVVLPYVKGSRISTSKGEER